MTRPFVIVVATASGFRSCCRDALVSAGYRVATPTTREGAEYFLASAYPPDVVVFSKRERWNEVLGDAVRHSVRRPAVVVVARCPDEKLGGTRPLEEAVQQAVEQLASQSSAWREQLVLGVELLDAPHRTQVALLNTLESAVRAGRHAEAVDRLDDLQKHAQNHFVDEESVMQLHGYRAREEHTREHETLLDEIGALAARCAGDELPLMPRVVLSLRDWLEGHIMTLDRAFAVHLARDPASPNGR